MRSKICQLLSILLVLILCLCAIPSCKSRDPLANTEIASIKIDEKERVNALITLDVRTERMHEGETVFFYEALPGESTREALQRDPLAKKTVSPEMRFRFPLTAEDGHSRLYSSFFAVYEDGTPLFENGFYIENPQILATNTSAFEWEKSPKAILNPDANDALSMSVMHAAYEVSFSELVTAEAEGEAGIFTFNGTTVFFSLTTLARLDKQIKEATDAGMQVSLYVNPDKSFSEAETIAIMDTLAARYAGGENGLITAVFLRTANIDEMPTLCRLTSLALRSHVANGRIYAIAPSASMGEIQSFFEALRLAFAASGELNWGAAVVPQASDRAPWEADDADAMSAANLSALSAALYSSPDEGRISYFALCDVAYSAENEDLQAASYAYTYLSAVSANAGLVFYRNHLNDASGLRAENGDGRRILSVVRGVDRGLEPADRRLCEQLAGEAWSKLTHTDNPRVLTDGTAAIGTMGLQETALFDFSAGDPLGFVGAGALDAPTTKHSASWNAPVLYTWIDPSYYGESGVRKVLSKNDLPKNATSLSVQLLAQIPDSEECRVTLRLEGTSLEGEHLTYENAIDVASQTWQTVTFGISAFSAELDHSKPCVMTLSTDPTSETDQEYALWIRGINARLPENDTSPLLVIALVIGSVAVSFLIVFLFYRLASPAPRTKKRRSRRAR